MLLKYCISLIFAFVNRAYKNSDFYMVHYWNNTEMCRSKVKCNPCRIADLLPKRRNTQNLTPLYSFGAILGVFLRYERLCFSGSILTVRHSKAAVCRFRVTKKRRISTTLFCCSEDGARERYSIICCTFSSCLQPLCQWLHRRWRTTGQSTVQGCLYRRSGDSYRMCPVWYWQVFSQE